MVSAPTLPHLTVKQAAQRLGMTPQGVRKAVREGRLEGSTQLLPSGKRAYFLVAEAVEAFHSDHELSFDKRADNLLVELALTQGALREKEAEVQGLKHDLLTAKRDLLRTSRALALQVQAFEALIAAPEARGEAVSEIA
jgi:hypothetical protein